MNEKKYIEKVETDNQRLENENDELKSHCSNLEQDINILLHFFDMLFLTNYKNSVLLNQKSPKVNKKVLSSLETLAKQIDKEIEAGVTVSGTVLETSALNAFINSSEKLKTVLQRQFKKEEKTDCKVNDL